jgi:uncharacterized protein (TIGR03790 family)
LPVNHHRQVIYKTRIYGSLIKQFEMTRYLIASVLCSVAAAIPFSGSIPVALPSSGLSPAQVGVVINDADPQSVAVGTAYQAARQIPPRNMVHLSFSAIEVLPQAEFFAAFANLSAALPSGVQSLALTWLWPYRVDCMSVTSAFAFNFSSKYCGNYPPCTPTALNPYYNSSSLTPFDDFGMRPTMLIAGWNAADALATIDAGVASGKTSPLPAALISSTFRSFY